MARREVLSNSFSAGEIAPELMMRSDLQIRNEALKQARNVTIMQGGGFRRRPATVDRAGLGGDCIIRTLGSGADDARILVFGHGSFEERALDGSLIAGITGCPWFTADLPNLEFGIENDRIIVTGGNFPPTALTRSAATWTVLFMDFAAGLSGGIRQPYWRYAAPDISIAPDDYTGSVTVEASDDAFTAAHVGARIRYAGIEILITAFTDAQHVDGTVQGSLYPTLDLTIGATAGFQVGQEVQGAVSEVKGVVSSVTDATHMTVQVLGTYTYFDGTEKLVGPTAVSTLSVVALNSTPASTVDWDEAMISAAYGYPKACALHKSRLMLGNFPNAKNAMAGSSTGDLTDFDVGTGLDTDAIGDTVGLDATLGLRHFGSTEQLLLLTEAGVHYVPEQVGSPLSATNLELLKIGPEAAGPPTPILAAEGLLFSEDKSGRLMGVLPTGTVRRSWQISDLSELAYHLMGTPKELALQAATSESDRLVLSLRDDGQIAVMNYRRGQQFTAWSLWSTTGEWRSITVAAGRLYAVSKRTINGSPVYRLEEFVEGTWGDGYVPGTGNLAHLNGATVGIWMDDAKLGSGAIAAGALTTPPGDLTPADYGVGFDFTLTAEVPPPIDGSIGLGRKIRICRAWLDVLGAVNLRVNGYSVFGFSNSMGVGGAVPPFVGQANVYLQGRSRDMTVIITQTEGGPCVLRSMTMEVTT